MNRAELIQRYLEECLRYPRLRDKVTLKQYLAANVQLGKVITAD